MRAKAGPYRYQPPREAVRLTAGPFVGVRDSLAAIERDPRYAYSATNLYCPEPEEDPGFLQRPGFTSLSRPAAGTVQGIFQHTYVTTAGAIAELTVAFVSGAMYRYNWNGTWTDLTPAATTISSTARIACVTYANQLVVSDGANPMWAYDAEAATRTLLNVDDTGVSANQAIYGQPVVYYGKLVGIRATDRRTLVWSEEMDPTTGYAQADYDNTWVLGQTDSEALTGLAATNEALYYFRDYSTGAIRGQVTANFRNDGTHDGVSASIGTKSPFAVVVVGQEVWFPDSNGRPHAIMGGALQPRYQGCRETVRTVQPTNLAAAWGAYSPLLGVVVFGYSLTASTTIASALVFHGRTGDFQGIWSRGSDPMVCGAIIKRAPTDGDSEPSLAFGTTGGYVFRQLDEGDGLIGDESNATGITQYVTTELVTAALGGDPEQELRLDRVTVELRADPNSTQLPPVTVAYQTSRADFTSGATLTLTNPVSGSAGYGREQRAELGCNGFGRWFRIKVRGALTSTARMNLRRVTAAAFPAPSGPTSR